MSISKNNYTPVLKEGHLWGLGGGGDELKKMLTRVKWAYKFSLLHVCGYVEILFTLAFEDAVFLQSYM